MTRGEIIEKGERQLRFSLDRLQRGGNPTLHIKIIASDALAQLDMLFLILDEEYENYDYWFDKFFEYL